MSREAYIDITNNPDLLRLAEAVRKAGAATVLRHGDEDLAVLSPVKPKRTRKAGRALSRSDSLFSIMGKAHVAEADSVVDNPDWYLAEAYYAEFTQPKES